MFLNASTCFVCVIVKLSETIDFRDLSTFDPNGHTLFPSRIVNLQSSRVDSFCVSLFVFPLMSQFVVCIPFH